VAEAVRKRLEELLDTATGSASHQGWPLGASPRDEDIVRALLDVPRLLGIARLDLFEIRDGRPQPWPARLAPHELARLAADGIRFEFEPLEVAA
jgi:hypothetical protein